MANKTKFIDLDATRPRLLNLDTAITMLNNCGIRDAHAEIAKIMAEPITLEQAQKSPKDIDFLNEFLVIYTGSEYSVQGVKCSLLQALETLMQRGLKQQQALRILALAVDIYEIKR